MTARVRLAKDAVRPGGRIIEQPAVSRTVSRTQQRYLPRRPRETGRSVFAESRTAILRRRTSPFFSSAALALGLRRGRAFVSSSKPEEYPAVGSANASR